MRSGPPSVRDAGGPGPGDEIVERFLWSWQSGAPDLDAYWAEVRQAGAGPSVLARLVKADLQYRFDRGERPAAADYLERFPELGADGDPVLSLAYEEYCLREERGESPDPERFCARYAAWTDSLASQLRYHRVLSQVAGAAPAPPKYPRPGEQFRQFHLTHELGRGGAARVYRARDESLGNREVALKVSADRGSEPAILGRLQHPNIVAVHTVVYQPENRLRGLCMPYRPGLPLDEVVRRLDPAGAPPRSALALWEVLRTAAAETGDPAPPAVPDGPGWAGFPVRGTYPEAVAWVAATLARALHHAHRQDVFHRDVKPANVLLTFREGPQLLDFNLAHDPHSAAQAEAALRGGTLPYMAPEQLEAFLDPERWDGVGAPADVYGLGLVVREMLTGTVPETPDPNLPLPRAIRGLLDRRNTQDLAPPQDCNGRGVPHALWAIVSHALAPRPEDRHPAASALAEDLESFLGHRAMPHTSNPSRLERSGNWAHRNATALLTALGLLVVAVAPLAWNFERLTTPFEQRRAFTQAVREFESDSATKALAHFEALAREAPSSPIVGFYRAAALQQAKRGRESVGVFVQAWSDPDARDQLRDWAVRHPRFLGQSVAVASGVLDSLAETRALDASSPDHAAELVERTFRFALGFEPSNDSARLGLSVLHEARREFSDAVAIVTALLDECQPTEVDRRLWLLQVRARNLTVWGRQSLEAGTPLPATLDLAGRNLQAALDDLNAYTRLTREGPPPRLGWIRCEALHALGILAERQGRPDEANQRFHESAAAFDQIAAYYEPFRAPEFDDLKRRVIEKRRLQAQPSPESPAQGH